MKVEAIYKEKTNEFSLEMPNTDESFEDIDSLIFHYSDQIDSQIVNLVMDPKPAKSLQQDLP